jgi:molybdopterin synthase sulfur carrier subunit
MSVTINIDSRLSHLTDGQTAFKVEGNTVGQCLDGLVKRFPGIKPRLFDKKGKLNKHIDIYVNKESSYPEELVKAVRDGDELHIMFLVTGG